MPNDNISRNPFAVTVASDRTPKGGALVEQSRAVAETQAMFLMAAHRPRNAVAAMDRILNACMRPTLANAAIYQYSRGGTDIQGPSIKLAEAIAQQWGNIDFGFREMERGVDPDGIGYSEVLAYAVDLETVTRKPIFFRVRHWRDTKKGGYALKDERDIYELVANQASRRMRNCILSIVPGDVIEAAQAQCELTLRTKVETGPEAIAKLVEAFGGFGVTRDQIEKRILRRLDSIQPAQVVQLRKIFASLRDGMSEPEEWFEAADVPTEPKAKTTEAPPQAETKHANPETKPAPSETPATKTESIDQSTGEIRTISGLSESQYRIMLDRAKRAGMDEAKLLAVYGSISLENLNHVLANLRERIEAANG